jgi:GTP-binding protein
MSHSFLEYRPLTSEMEMRRNGVLIAFEEGVATTYALKNAEDRGVFFITPGTPRFYKGMIVGEHKPSPRLGAETSARPSKLDPTTGLRAGRKLVHLQAPVEMTLERGFGIHRRG